MRSVRPIHLIVKSPLWIYMDARFPIMACRVVTGLASESDLPAFSTEKNSYARPSSFMLASTAVRYQNSSFGANIA